MTCETVFIYFYLLYFTDYHALTQDSASSPHKRRLFRTFRHGPVFVSQLSSIIAHHFLNPCSRIIGVQSFKGSLRRSCYVSPTLGEGELSLSNQFCGGYIDPITMNATGYIQMDNTSTDSTKGYICPLGQVCRVRPMLVFNVFFTQSLYLW